MDVFKLIKNTGETFDYGGKAEELHEFNQSCTQMLIQLIKTGKCEDIDCMLFDSKRIRKSFSGYINTPEDYFCYEFGVFNENFKILQETLQAMNEKEKEQKTVKALDIKHNTNIRDVIEYLHKRPYSRQTVIAEILNIDPKCLADMLNKMFENGLIDRYGVHTDTQYCLTTEGRKIYQTYVQFQ